MAAIYDSAAVVETNKTIDTGSNTLTVSTAANANINALLDQDVRTTASPTFAGLTLTSLPLAAGNFTPTWSSFVGISVSPSNLAIHWQRVGSTVTCSLYASGATLSGGQIVAHVSVPVASAGLISNPASAAGAGVINATGNGVVILGNSGFNNRVALYAGASTAAVGAYIGVSFSYAVS
jgi:hypothetical protein